jgi:TolB-like protein/Tfp pilus assembly protein PilF
MSVRCRLAFALALGGRYNPPGTGVAKSLEENREPTSGTARLESWKEIAAYLRRDVTTVRRWEKREQLPVRRHRHGKLGSVYAFTGEIDAWREQRSADFDGGAVSQQSIGRNATLSVQAEAAAAHEIQPSVVVLPFANISPDSEGEYFADGLAEEIINSLAQFSRLKVIARTSAFAFKGKNEDIRKIGQALGVTNVLEGSVRRAGNRLRIIAQLIQAADGTHLWSQRYDCELTDVFALQGEIAAAIGGTLGVKLTGQHAHPYEPSPSAYEAFLKARQYQRSAFVQGGGGADRIDECFKQAIALDPQWADPHSALALQHFLVGILGVRPNETIPLARAEARKALDLLPSEPIAHAVLGALAAVNDYDWNEADEQFKLARASGPIAPSVQQLYAGFYLSPLGQFEEALQHSEKVIAQDPLNIMCRGRQLTILLCAEKYERAIVEAQKLLEFDEQLAWAHSIIALAQFLQGKLAEARRGADEAFCLAPLNPIAAGLQAGLLKQRGEADQVEKLLASLREMPALGMILYHLVCSETEAAIGWYERAIEQRHTYAVEWASAGFLRPLRSSPRWSKVAAMMNLPAQTAHDSKAFEL